jgi:hypothetical protein
MRREVRSAQFFNGFRNWIPVLILCFISLAFYQTLIYSTPTIYWNDAHIRWALRDQLLLGEWLPGVQASVVPIAKITSDLDFLQGILSLLAIGSLTCFYVLARHLFSSLTGLIAFMFLAFNSMFAAFAIVPYSEILFIGFVFLILVLLDEPVFSRRFYFGLFLLNLASLTRYEGWFLTVFFIAEMALRSFFTVKWQIALWQTLKMAFLSSVAPMAWLMIGMSKANGLRGRLNEIFEFVIAPSKPRLSDHILERLNSEYIHDFSSQFFSLLIRQIHVEILVLAVLGFSLAILGASYRSVHLRILLFLVLDWLLLAFFQPWKFGNLRQPFFAQVFLVLYASYGLASGISWACQKLGLFIKNVNTMHWANYFIMTAAIMLTLRIIPSTYTFIVNTSKEAGFLTPHKIAKWLEPRLEDDDAILIIDDTDYYPYALASYFEYPLERILDDRLQAHLIQESLENARMVYIVELYKSRDGLSLTEIRILKALESSQIQAEQFLFDGARVWYAPANEVSYSPYESIP